MSIMAQVESSGAVAAGGVGPIMVARRVAGRLWAAAAVSVDYYWRGEYRGADARNTAGCAQENAGATKGHVTKRNVAFDEADPRARRGRRKRQLERIASAVGSADNPDRWEERQGYVLVEDVGCPLTLILIDFNVSVVKLLLKSKSTVPVNEVSGPKKLPKSPIRFERLERRPLSRQGPRSGPAPQPRLRTRVRLAHEGSDLRPSASAPTCFMNARPNPLGGPLYGPFALHH